MIRIVDYGAGNLVSVKKALDWLGQDSAITSDPAEVRRASKIILPGVGHFGATAALAHSGLETAIAELEEAMDAKRHATEAHVTARAGIKTSLAKALKALRKVDPIVRNKYRNDPVTLAAWDNANRTTRHQRKPKPEQTPAPPQ